jgi:hypothetical protein
MPILGADAAVEILRQTGWRNEEAWREARRGSAAGDEEDQAASRL